MKGPLYACKLNPLVFLNIMMGGSGFPDVELPGSEHAVAPNSF